MAGFFKLQKEWLENGLTWAEAGVLSDILSWNGKDGKGCSLQERADRCFLTKEGVRKVILKLNERGYLPSTMLTRNVNYVDTTPSTMLTKSANSVDDFKEKKEKIPPHPPIKKKKNYEEQEELTLDKSNVPNADASADKKTSPKKKKKYTDEEIKLHGELKAIFCEEWLKTHGEEFYWGPAAMSATIKIADQIRFLMPESDKADNEKLKFNFRAFLKKIFSARDGWLRTNATPQVIASKFNEIYTTIKQESNGNNNNGNNRKTTVSPEFIEKHMRKAGLII